MNKCQWATAIISVIQCLSFPAHGQIPDSTFTSYDWIRPSVISAKSSHLEVRGDTSYFNPSSVLLHEGASLDALLVEIPGLLIDPKGNVSVNGRPVRELLLEGKRYFGTDVAAGLRNIPANLIGSIKAYEKESDVGLISGVDQADKEMVIDISLKQKYKDRPNNSINMGYGWKDRYDGKYSGTLVSKRRIYSMIASSENIAALQKSSGTSIRTGLGDNCGKRQSEAGITSSVHRNETDINSSFLFKSTGKDVRFTGHDEYYRTSGYHYSETSGLTGENNYNINAQSTIEWKDIGRMRLMLKPQITLTRNASEDSLAGESFRGDSLSPYYKSLRHSAERGTTLKAGSALILSRQMSRKGRTLAINLEALYKHDNQLVRASTDGSFFIRNRTFSSWRDRESILNTKGVDTKAQIIYNEPVGKGRSVQLSYKQTWQMEFFNRDNTIFDETVPVKDISQSATGRYDYMSGDLSAAYRMYVKSMSLTAGVSMVHIHSNFRYLHNEEHTDTSSLRIYFSPRIILNCNISEHNSLMLTYKGYSKSPSVKQMLPIASNTNPIYIQNPNPGLRPSFTQEINLTWKVSNASGSRGLAVGGNFKTIKEDFSTMAETNTESSGRIVTPVNVDGNMGGGLDISSHITAGSFLFTGHFTSDHSRKNLYIFNDVAKLPEPGINKIGFARQVVAATYRANTFEINALMEGEIASSRLDLRPDMDMRPWTLSAGASSTWKPGAGWTISADAREIWNGGYAFADMNQNYLIMNAKISKSILRGNIVFQFDARDILSGWDNLTFTTTSERRGFKLYEGNATYFIGRLIIIL